MNRSSKRSGKLNRGGIVATVVTASFALLAVFGEARAQYDDSYPTPCPQYIGPDGIDVYYYQGKLFHDQRWSRTGYPDPGVTHIATYEGESEFIDVTEEWKWQNPGATFLCGRIVVIPGVLVVDANVAQQRTGTVVPWGEEVADTVSSDPTGGVGGGGGHETDEQEHTYLCYRYRYGDGTYGPWLWCVQIS